MKAHVVDIETSGRNKYTDKIVLVGHYYFDTKNPEIGHYILDDVYHAFTQYSLPLVMHNAPFDVHLLDRVGYYHKYHDTYDTYLMASHVRNDLPAKDLKTLAWWLFGETYPELTALRQWMVDNNCYEEDLNAFDMSKPPLRLVTAYLKKDLLSTARIFSHFWPMVKDNYAFHQDCKIIRPLVNMQAHGIMVDRKFLKKFVANGDRAIARNTKQAIQEMKIEGNRKPTGNALREHLANIGVRERTASGKVKADEVVLREKARDGDKVCTIIRRIRSKQKDVNTYARNMLAASEGYDHFHPNLMLSAAITRRFRARGMYGDSGIITKGQVQNFPQAEEGKPGIRHSITVPSTHRVAKLDLASIEARLGAHAMYVFLNIDKYVSQYRKSDKYNIYLDVAWECEEDDTITKKDVTYQAYKHGVLGIQYGVGVKTYYVTMHDKFDLPVTFDQCSAIYRKIRATRPEFGKLQRAVSSIVETQGFIRDDYGAIYYLPPEERYKGVNYYCQGCAGNVLKDWWLRCEDVMGPEDWFFNTVHDELDVAIKYDSGAKKRVAKYCQCARDIDLFSLPIIAEASPLVLNWGEAG